ncbi:APC family permease [Gracilimonas mengyeensis]|uniref:Amino acid transporter n=1 Tax=Gracilimonas mengyeensis TaxID=1302730 RepID=A0A521F5Q1_9BACT|nr:APC family permease [Gracilimonas mengyeensis]SMO91469.1 Amino acid transporter [Gracilimonas mengyeensis]
MSQQSQQSQKGELERTLGLGPAMAIGIGTMVGAGIFVFPGIAGGDAGPAAMISFLLAGTIAMLVALCTTELATAMPQSGGGYYFASRTFGPFAGTLIGIGQCVGLVFASSFYLMGFGEYAGDLMNRLGFSLGDPVVLIALGTALFLTVVNLIGTEGAGKLQNGVVIVLTGILTVLFGYGALEALGVIGSANMPEPFAPKGYFPILTTTALIFTSYLGFVQIATVAGEIKEPQKNLPKALIGSVAIVTILYILTLFVSTSLFDAEKLSSFGETATVEVAQAIIGNVGGIVVMGAGLLATLSSANASILSSSRAIYALSADSLVPSGISKVNASFGTPHRALFIVGLSIATLTLFGHIEVLAEVASLLHLVLYGTICLALISLRKKNPVWYAPTFRISGAPLLPFMCALSCFGLIAFMQPISIIIGAAVLAVSALWYLLYARGSSLERPKPPHIQPELRKPKILIPVELPDPSSIPEALLKPFKDLEIILLGYKKVTEQTSPEQSREELDEEVKEDLKTIEEGIRKRGYQIVEKTVFTPDLAQSIDRYIAEKSCNAVLTVKPIQEIKRLLVPLYSQDQLNKRLSTILYDLSRTSKLPVTLINMSSQEIESEEIDSEKDLQEMAKQLLKEAGLKDDQIYSKSVQVTDVAEAVEQISAEDDLVVLGESSSSDRKSFFDTLHNKISAAVSCPVLAIVKPESSNEQD